MALVTLKREMQGGGEEAHLPLQAHCPTGQDPHQPAIDRAGLPLGRELDTGELGGHPTCWTVVAKFLLLSRRAFDPTDFRGGGGATKGRKGVTSGPITSPRQGDYTAGQGFARFCPLPPVLEVE
jgi:hypothetical protein